VVQVGKRRFARVTLPDTGAMIALIQRVSQARVTVEGRTTGEIGAGLLALVCAERGDTEAQAERLLAKLLSYRVFSDAEGKMNLPVQNIDGQGTAGGCWWCRSSRWPPTPTAAPGRASRRRRRRGRPPPLRSFRDPRARASVGADRRVRRDDAGQPDQRWSRDVLAARAASRNA
jgi:hypothetical protein